MSLNNHSPGITSILKAAGEAIMDVYRSPGYRLYRKDDDSPVTAADFASEIIIKEGLSVLTPGIEIISEESAPIIDDGTMMPDDYWIVDPLDGTTEFISRNDEFCILLARVTDGLVNQGYLYSPVSETLWYAIRGKGAFRVSGKEITRLPCHNPGNSLRILKSRSHSLPGEQDWITELQQSHDITDDYQGSALKFCMIAGGYADLYLKLGIINKWDVAAGSILLEESGGGIFSIATGMPLKFGTPGHKTEPFLAYGNRITDPEALVRNLRRS